MIEPVPSSYATTAGSTPAAPDQGPETPAAVARRRSIQGWVEKIRDTRERKHKGAYEMFRRSAQRAWAGADEKWISENKYVANQLQTYVKQRVATLYAKNPRVQSKRRRTLDYVLWDGTPESVMEARQTVDMHSAMMMAGDMMAANPELLQHVEMARQLLEEIKAVALKRIYLDRQGRTLECLIEWAWAEQVPPFQRTAKMWVKRAIIYGIGWIKLGYQRSMEPAPDKQYRIDDISAQIGIAEALAERIEAGEVDEDAPDIERLRQTLEAINGEPEILTYEGLTYDEVDPATVTVDPACTDLPTLTGAAWVAQQWCMDIDEVQETWGVKLRDNQYTIYFDRDNGTLNLPVGADLDQKVMVYKIWDAKARKEFIIADGYPDYIVAPVKPDVDIDGFFPFFGFAPNAMPTDKELYPKSDIELLWSMQQEYNAQREDLRVHRRRNRPGFIAAAGALDEDAGDLDALRNNEINGITLLKGLMPGQSVADLLQPKPTIAIDAALYDTSQASEDWSRVAGSQDAASIGAVQGATATESAIAEGSRDTSRGSNVDDLDAALSALSHASAQVALAQFDEATVKEIVGDGAVWPTYSRKEIGRMVRLQVVAGSSGRPNQAADTARLRDLGPLMMQTPGMAEFTQRKLAGVWDEDVDPDEIFSAGMMSIVAMNALASAGTGGGGPAPDDDMAEDPEDDPGSQGDRGGNKARAPDEAGGEAAPAFPSGVPGM